jgi:hypothetical protein
MGMESELFIPNLNNPKLITLVRENIGRISNGSSSHCAGALTLGFEKAVELKKKSKGVLLRCSRNGCTRYNNPVFYSSVGVNIFCTLCAVTHANYYMACTGCGLQRVHGSYVSCQSCKKRFV